MIGQLTGTIAQRNTDSIVLDVGGVGYLVHVSSPTLARLLELPEPVRLLTHLAVREHSLDLYGFFDKAELEFFTMLISVSGIGPKSAIAILSIVDVTTLTAAVREGDISYLTKVSGIGKKSAERIVVELRDKLGAIDTTATPLLKEETDALDALKSLGYSATEAREALKLVSKEAEGTNSRLKEALKILGK